MITKILSDSSIRQSLVLALERVRESDVVTNGDIQSIAIANTHYVGVSPHQVDIATATEVEEFMATVENILKEKWNVSFCFYCWFDDMASQIRFSSIPSSAASELPFLQNISAATLAEVLVRALQIVRHEIVFDYERLPVYSTICAPTAVD
jgi:hypothetical protein